MSSINALPLRRRRPNVLINSEPGGRKGADRRTDQGKGEPIMWWHATSTVRRQSLRDEAAMARSGRPQVILIMDLPVPSEPKSGPEWWRG
jgi:hypothetical protein